MITARPLDVLRLLALLFVASLPDAARAQPGLTTAFVKVDTGMTLQYVAQGDPISYEFARDFQAGTAFTPLPPAFLEMMIAEVQRVPAAMFHEVAKGAADPRHVENLGRIKARTLLLWGERDSMFSKADQDGLLKAIPASRLIPYADTGHALHWEHPERFAKDLMAFMAK